MAIATETPSSFPLAHCDRCGKTVVTCVMLDDTGAEYRACAHCDARIAGDIAWVGSSELTEAGYEVGIRPKTGGCGCGSGGCSIKRNSN